MAWVNIIVKVAPYIFYLSSLLFIIILAVHLKNIRRKDMLDEVTINEDKIHEEYSNMDDTAVLDELNAIEGSTSDTAKKE